MSSLISSLSPSIKFDLTSFLLNLDEINLNNIFRVKGMIKTKPIKSVKKPGNMNFDSDKVVNIAAESILNLYIFLLDLKNFELFVLL